MRGCCHGLAAEPHAGRDENEKNRERSFQRQRRHPLRDPRAHVGAEEEPEADQQRRDDPDVPFLIIGPGAERPHRQKEGCKRRPGGHLRCEASEKDERGHDHDSATDAEHTSQHAGAEPDQDEDEIVHGLDSNSMKWSWRLGSIAGIALYVHATFVLLLAWIAIGQYRSSHSAIAALNGVLFVLAVFLMVVLHELGHALMARRYGVRTRDITLLPIGGVARLERMPREPKQELLVALAGPAVNVAIAGLLYLLLQLTGGVPAILE